jgi:hypothetical protein
MALVAAVTQLSLAELPPIISAYAQQVASAATEQARATYTAQARATATTLTRQFSPSYTPNGIGPCDSANPTPVRQQSGIPWEWNPYPNMVTCPGNGVTRISDGGGYVNYFGLHGQFPQHFTLSVTMTFHSSASARACLMEEVNLEPPTADQGNAMGVALCDGGAWTTAIGYSTVTPPGGSVREAKTYTIALTWGAAENQFTINGAGSLTIPSAIDYLSPGVTLSAYGYHDPDAWVDIQRFTLTPLT